MTELVGRNLDGAVVAVVGAGGGLGGALARCFAGRGASLILAGRRAETLARTADGDPRLGGSPHVVCDVRDPAAGDTLVDAVGRHGGVLDGVVFAHGVVAFGNLVDTSDEVIEELFLTNVMGPLWMLKRVVPLLAAPPGSRTGGFVVNLSAVVAESPLAGMSVYSATKGALSAADTALTRELRRVGISVCDVRPPHTETGLANRPLAGSAPRLPEGLAPEMVAEIVVNAVVAGATEVPSGAFAG